MKTQLKKQIIIAGPCAAESRERILKSIKEAKTRNIDYIRISLWKPRTRPGFDGLGEKGIKLLVEAAKQGINPATEVIIPEHAYKAMDAVLKIPNAKLLLWIGSRNQNHFVQKEIAKVASRDKRVKLMVKNQPWSSKEHWEGIIDHCLSGGINPENLLICHRGFIPNGHGNPHGYRNIPDYEMAMDIKQKTGLSMIFDPSHTGGSVDNVFRIISEASQYSFDGIIIETHPNPKEALTDAKQQITWKQFDKLFYSPSKSEYLL